MNGKGVPVVVNRVVQGQWQLNFYKEFDSVLFNENIPHKKILKLIEFVENKNLGAGFRREIIIDSFPFLCGVKPEEKTIYIGNRRLSRELALLKLHEVNPISIDGSLDKLFFQLKEHVEKISTLAPNAFPSEIEWVTQENNLPELWDAEKWEDINEASAVILKKLVKCVGDYSSSAFEKVSDYGLTLTAQYDLIRVHLLKFLALLPSLDHDKSGKEVKRNLLESLRRLIEDSKALDGNKKRGVRQLPLYLISTFKITYHIAAYMPAGFLARVVRFLVRTMAKRFIAGESISTAHDTIGYLRRTKREATLDQLGELVVSQREADEYFEKVLQLIHGLKQHIPRGQTNKAGILNAHVSIKVSALSHDFRPEAFESTFSKVAPRLKRILQEAQREEVFINVDAEHYQYRDLVLNIFRKVLLDTPELKDFAQTGIVVQAYLRDASAHLDDVIALGRERKIRMPIRLVKGAYWDAETIEGEAHQFVPPQFLNKEESDIHFRQLCYKTLKNSEYLQLALASHNLQDHAFAEALREHRFPQAPVIEHQCLHMTYEALSHGLAKMGWPVRNYMPIGNLLVGMAYLVRRIMENSSQVGVLSIMRSHQKASGLISPIEVHKNKRKAGTLTFDSFTTQTKSDFAPVRPLKLYKDDERRDLEAHIQSLLTRITEKQDEFQNANGRKVICSSRPSLILDVIQENSNAEAIEAVNKAEAALTESFWGKQSHTLSRVAILLRAADLMLLKRNELSALMVLEAGKTMSEALADVDEGIDFINFYVRQEIELQLSGDKISNRGVISVIAPWNFPLAIPCGMTVAPLVAGNAVILKPAEQTPLIGKALYDLLIEAGVPSDILYLIQGDGEIVGAPLVSHKRTAGVVFTGSKNVGTWIYRHGAQELITHYAHQTQMQKKIITEMGGKNAIIVTNNCELDETISGILYASFGHAGQKCSATSRVIVHREVKDALVMRLVQAIKDLKVGESLDPSTSVNPLISEEDQERVKKAIEEAKEEVIKVHGKILVDRSFEKLPGFCVGPALFEIPASQAKKKDSWAQREIFGPVIHLMEYESLVEAVELFNSTEYALTGGIYSQSQDDINFLVKFLRAGNLYVNRPNTGARVGIEPFGGFKMSGTGPKAGGTEYVKEFHFALPNAEAPIGEIKFAVDSGYQLLTPRPSLISIAGRISRFETFGHSFLEQFEIYMGSVSEKEKLKLSIFITWIKGNLHDYLNGKHMNFVIPGQLSYNDKSLIKESGLFVTVSGSPSLKSIHYLFGALSLGCGLSIACVTEESYTSWRGILELAWKAGFSKANIDCSLVSKETLKDLYKQPHYSFMYAGRFNQFHDVLYQGILEGKALTENMRLVLSESDGISLATPQNVLDQFVWTRSLAVNTMRHGAPLELN